MVAQDERWLPVVGYEGRYEVSDLGRVRITATLQRNNKRPVGHVLVQDKCSQYAYVKLWVDGCSPRRIGVHALVAAAFIGPCPPRHVVDHIDDDPFNNAASNLRYITHAANIARAGGRGGVLSNAQVMEIRKLRGLVSYCALAARYGVSYPTISYTMSGRNYKHLPLPAQTIEAKPLSPTPQRRAS